MLFIFSLLFLVNPLEPIFKKNMARTHRTAAIPKKIIVTVTEKVDNHSGIAIIATIGKHPNPVAAVFAFFCCPKRKGSLSPH